MLARLTPKQSKFFSQIAAFLDREGVAPTLRESQELGRFASTRSAAQYLDALEEAGYIKRGKGPRNLQLLVTPEDARVTRSPRGSVPTTSRRRGAAGSILLVNGTDLHRWAARRDAQSTLPQIVRRLVFATAERPSRVAFGSAEAVQLGGWDGVTVADHGSIFVPEGATGWELGTTSSVKGKADEDYEKRTIDPGELVAHESTFVFVTARRWKEKNTWAAARRKEGRWRDVRAYDADDLEAWMELAPVVHLWVSSLLSKAPEGAIDLDSFWQGWAGATKPTLTPAFLLAGRSEAEKQLSDWVSSAAPTLAVQAETREEAVAAFAATLQRMPDNKHYESTYRSVVVSTPSAWQHLASGAEPMILIPVFDNPPVVTNAVRNGHRVILPLNRADSASQKTVVLGPIQRKTAETELLSMISGPTPTRADDREGEGRSDRPAERQARELARLGRRSVTAFRRRIALAPELEMPAWAQPAAGRVLIAPLLAGKWDETKEADQAMVSKLAGMSYSVFEEHLVRWSHESDAPVRHVGNFWFIVAKEDAWPLLHRLITREDLRRLAEVAIAVLGTVDPRFDLPEDKQWMARAIGHAPLYSDALRHGLADTLALLGTDGALTTATAGESAEAVAHSVVARLLESANADWRLWASLSHLLPLLAEAAPDHFLAAVDTGVRGDAPVLREMFREGADAFTSSSPHTGLLWALERVGWSPEYLPRAAVAIGRLAVLDPGGKLANRPAASLRHLFLLWHPQTNADLQTRLRVLDTLRERVPTAAWRLMNGLLPQPHDMVMNHQPATWRTWGQEETAVTHAEYARGVHEIVRRMLQDVGSDGERWCDLIEHISRLPQEDEKAVLDGLAGLDLSALPPGACAAIWHALRKIISRHRSHPDANWSMPTDRIDRLAELHTRFTPTGVEERFAWLFGNHPALLDGREPDWDAHENVLSEHRRDAVAAVFAEGGVDALMHFASVVEQPNHVGIALSGLTQSDAIAEELLARHLASPTLFERGFARGFAWASVRKFGHEWAEDLLRRRGESLRPNQRAELIDCLPYEPHTFDLVDAADEETQDAYWKRMYAFGIPDGLSEYGARRLLKHGRPYAALDFVAARFHLSKKELPPAVLIADVLEAAIHAKPSDIDPLDQSLGYDVGELLDKLVDSPGDVDRSRIASLEWAFMPAIRDHHHPRLLHDELARDPAFFVDIASIVYRAKGEEPRDLSEQDSMRARVAYDVLDTWRTIPGRHGNTIDALELGEWLSEARRLLAEKNRAVIGDHLIGQLFAASPTGDDGAWPHPIIRDVIEDLGSTEIERGISIRIYNSRGVVTKNLDEGGEQERQLVDEYERWANLVNDKWPRTAAMLRQVAASYQHEATRSDIDVELRDHLDD